MATGWPRFLLLALFLAPGTANADEAITHQGRCFAGTLQLNAFLLSKTAKPINAKPS